MASSPMRLSVDIGGTFTDLVVEENGVLRLFKSPTVPSDPVQGILSVLDVAAAASGLPLPEFLARVTSFTHATTRGLNAVLTGNTARTAFLTTAGHPDVLLLREGGRHNPYDFTVPYPEPYVPRSLTFEVPERVLSTGKVLVPIDIPAVEALCTRIAESGAEALAVCLLWSTVNPVHELLVAELVESRLPGIPYTLSHQLNPSLREYRRASSAAIDASLKPLMSEYVSSLTTRLRGAGLEGRILMVTSMGGVVDASDAAAAPILTINSGPSMAPVAGRAYAAADLSADAVIIADAGGTTYDVTLVRRGEIPSTRSAWVGGERTGHMTGLPSIDVKSVGAGGGSIAWVDSGGLLHIGPQSAGSEPGPACYGRGGTAATVTDASLVLGYLDPANFSSGSMTLDTEAARGAVERDVAIPLGIGIVEAASAILELTTEQMVRAIEEITLQQGIDPARAVLVGGGGAAGLNAAAVADRLGCSTLVMPAVGSALAAAGALMSDITGLFSTTVTTVTNDFDAGRVNDGLNELIERASIFAARVGGEERATTSLFAEARYPQQIWELEVPLQVSAFLNQQDVEDFVADFHSIHNEILGIMDSRSPVEIVSWGARVSIPLPGSGAVLSADSGDYAEPTIRRAYVKGQGMTDMPVRSLASFSVGKSFTGPMLVESPFTTIVIADSSEVAITPSGSLIIHPINNVRESHYTAERGRNT